ncbi:hypothetical protein THIX_70213 [Thiomonas sp. X19]|nr:hypothetical protein THIX_70213 [Thiomonas sp. X19]
MVALHLLSGPRNAAPVMISGGLKRNDRQQEQKLGELGHQKQPLKVGRRRSRNALRHRPSLVCAAQQPGSI